MRSTNDEVNDVLNRTVVILMYGDFGIFFLGKAFQRTMKAANEAESSTRVLPIVELDVGAIGYSSLFGFGFGWTLSIWLLVFIFIKIF